MRQAVNNTGINENLNHQRWVLVANAAGAKLFESNGVAYKFVKEIDHPEGRKQNRELRIDRHGRAANLGAPVGGTGRMSRQAFSTAVEPKEHEAELFAKSLAEILESGRTSNQFNELILVANPWFMGKLKMFLTHNTSKCLVESYEKDFANTPPNTLPNVLSSLIDK